MKTLLVSLVLFAAPRPPAPEFKWVNPRPAESLPDGVRHATYASKVQSAHVGYYVYLPPGYDEPRNAKLRYPVLYYLHGGRPGGEHRSVGLAKRFDAGIRAGGIPMIYVFVNGGLVSHYDYPSEKSFGETTFVKELVPHVDRTYRTIASREGRVLEGFSQGGRAVGRILFKYPEVFSCGVALSGGHQNEKRIAEQNGRESKKLVFPPGQNTFDLAAKYAARRSRPPVHLLVGVGDKDKNHEGNLVWMKHLEGVRRTRQGLPH